MILSDLIHKIEVAAKLSPPLSYDNSGLIVGDPIANISRVLVSLDCSFDVIEEAASVGAELIFAHHPPLFWEKAKKITADTPEHGKVFRLIQKRIAVFAAHSSFDASPLGTNDTLFDIIGLSEKENFICEEEKFFGRIGILNKETTLAEFAGCLSEKLDCSVVRYCGNKDTKIKKVALCTGSGAEYEYFIEAKKLGCNVFVTGDVKYHNAQYALDLGLSVVDASHYASERIAMSRLIPVLQKEIPGVEFIDSSTNGQIFNHCQ
ncbi:MAG: Nif3-like dinuclear metal center hexameric protein [Clostridiales bacterium]|jgi:dinuclear metal center YbgI/SA1388 family protein|nr:Nif3-like dinuclear metal center hexameric protein [Clostridiales bacterium]